MKNLLVVVRYSLVTALLAGSLLAGGCAHKRVTGQPTTAPAEEREKPEATDTTTPATPKPTPPVAAGDAVALGIQVATLARDQLGRPYRWGGENPSYGFDCSGLVQWTYGSVGVDLPRVVREQQKAGKSITGDRLRPGDLVFFAINGRTTSHVGVYVGDGRFVHAPRAGQPVREDSLDDSYWRQRWTDSRRMVGS